MDFTYDEEQDALRDAVRGLVGKAYGDYENRRQRRRGRPRLRREAVGADGRDGPARPAVRRGGRRRGRRPGRDRHRLPGARPGARPGAVPDLGGAGRRAGLGVRHRRAAPRAARRPARRRERARFRARRAGRRWSAEPSSGHRDPRRRRVDAVRGQGAGAARRPRRRAGGQRRPARRRHRAVPGRRARLPSAPATRPTTAAAPPGWPSTAPRPSRSASPASTSPTSIATVQDIARVMAANQALGAMQFALPRPRSTSAAASSSASPLNDLPGADLPGGGHVRLARADPLDGRLGDDGGGARATRRRSPTRPARVSVQVSRAGGTSARRRSSCTAASR